MNDMTGPRRAAARGIDHLALVTDDLPATMDFYTRVMRMRLVDEQVPVEAPPVA